MPTMCSAASSPRIQPHYQTITGQDQVQIYEVREVDEDGVLAGRLFSLFESAKDNRIQPKGSLVRYLDHSSGHAECASSMPAAIKNGDRGGLNLCSLAKIVSNISTGGDLCRRMPSGGDLSDANVVSSL